MRARHLDAFAAVDLLTGRAGRRLREADRRQRELREAKPELHVVAGGRLRLRRIGELDEEVTGERRRCRTRSAEPRLGSR